MPTPITITPNISNTYGSTPISGDGEITITGDNIIVNSGTITFGSTPANLLTNAITTGSASIFSTSAISTGINTIAVGTLPISSSITVTPNTSITVSGDGNYTVGNNSSFIAQSRTLTFGPSITNAINTNSATISTIASASGSVNTTTAGTLSIADSHPINSGTSVSAISTVHIIDADKNLFGTMYSDTLTGGAGNDVMHAGRGKDTLISNGGHDTLTGGRGADVFVIALHDSTQNSTITDFTKGMDHIKLIGENFANLSFKSLNGGTDITDKTLGTQTGHLLLDHTDYHTLTASDFIFN